MKCSDNKIIIIINILSSDKILRNKIKIACYKKISKNVYKRYIINIILNIISFSLNFFEANLNGLIRQTKFYSNSLKTILHNM